MLSEFTILGALSLVSFNLGNVQAQGLLELENVNHGDLFVPLFNIRIEEPELATEEDETKTEPLLGHKVNQKVLPIFTPLKSLHSWKENQTSFISSIVQIKMAIEAIHDKHESLLNHIKCVFPVPPKNCSDIQSHSKWNWTSLIPTGFKPQSFFHPSSEQDIGPVAAVFIAAIEHLENKQNKIHDFVSCACQKSNCTAKPSWSIFNGTYWHNKIHHLNPFNWHKFNISKPHKPSSGYFSGSIIHKPVLAFFNHSSGAGNGHTGFVVAITGGHVPAFPSEIYGSSAASQETEGKPGFGGYISASIPTYSGTVIIGNFPHSSEPSNSTSNSTSGPPGAFSENVQGQIYAVHQTNHTSNTVQQVINIVNHTSSGSSHAQSNVTVAGNVAGVESAGKPIPNSVSVPKCPGSEPCGSAVLVVNETKPLVPTEVKEPVKLDEQITSER